MITTVEPSAVHTPESIWSLGAQFAEDYQAWLRSHSVDPNMTYRVDHYAGTHITVYQFDANKSGKAHLDLSTGDIAERKPFSVQTHSVPPQPDDYQ